MLFHQIATSNPSKFFFFINNLFFRIYSSFKLTLSVFVNSSLTSTGIKQNSLITFPCSSCQLLIREREGSRVLSLLRPVAIYIPNCCNIPASSDSVRTEWPIVVHPTWLDIDTFTTITAGTWQVCIHWWYKQSTPNVAILYKLPEPPKDFCFR